MKFVRRLVLQALLLSGFALCATLFAQSQPQTRKLAGMPGAGKPAPANVETNAASDRPEEALNAAAQKPDNDPAKRIKKGSGGKEDSGLHHESGQDESKPIVINFEFYFYHMGPGRVEAPDVKGMPKALEAANDKMAQSLANAFKGTGSLTINPDGSYDFAGTCPALYSENSYTEFALAVGVKSSEGSLVLFPVSGSLRYGKYWNKQGTNKTIRDNWKAFAKDHDWRYAFRYQDVVEPSQPSAAPSGQNSSGGVDVGTVLNDVSTGLAIFTSILAIL